MKQIVRFDGDNFEDVLAIVPGYVRCKKCKIELHIFIPFVGDKTIRKDCFIILNDNKIEIEYD